MDAISDIAAEIADAYDRGSPSYRNSWDRPHPWLEEQRNRFVATLWKGARIIDVGCGPGHDSAFFNSLGFDTLGIDVSPKMIEAAKGRYPQCAFAVMNGLDIGRQFKDAFDGAVLVVDEREDVQVRELLDAADLGGVVEARDVHRHVKKDHRIDEGE